MSLTNNTYHTVIEININEPRLLMFDHVLRKDHSNQEMVRAAIRVTPVDSQEEWRFHSAYVESVVFNTGVGLEEQEKLEYFLMVVGSIGKMFFYPNDFSYQFSTKNDHVLLAVSDEVLKAVTKVSSLVMPFDDINYLHGDGVSKILERLAQNGVVVTRSGVTAPAKDYAFILEVPAVEGASYVIFGDDKVLYLVGDSPSTMGHLITMEYRTDCHGPTSRDLDLVINHLGAYGVPHERALNLVLGMVHCVTEGNRTLTRVSRDFCSQLETVENRLWQHDFAKVWQLLDPRLPGRMINDAAMQAAAEWMKKHNIRIHRDS